MSQNLLLKFGHNIKSKHEKMLRPFFGKKFSFWPFLDFFTKENKIFYKISNDGAQNRNQIYYKHLTIISSLGMKKCWETFSAKNLASTSF